MLAALLVSIVTTTSPLVTGNGFGYAVVEPDSGAIIKLYAHPYRFMRMRDDSVDGVPTTNLVKSAVWTGLGARSEARYVAQSHVIATSGLGGTARVVMPFGLHRNAVLTASEHGALNIVWQHPVKTTREAHGARVYAFEGVPEQVAVVTMQGGVALIVLESERELGDAMRDFATWRGERGPWAITDDEVHEHEAWREPAKGRNADEVALWRQSETILRMAQIRESNRPGRRNHGLINASLPNGDWFIPWVRDGAYAIMGLTHMGHTREAKLALDAWLTAGPMRMTRAVRNAPYQVSLVRYFGDGSEDADRSGQPNQNIEFDSWGLALWAISDYVMTTHDRGWLSAKAGRGTVYATARDYIVAPILANTDPYGDGIIMARDSSIWEQNSLPRLHYAYSTIAVIHGLARFRDVATFYGDTATAAMLTTKLAALVRGFKAAYVRNGTVVGTLEESPKNAMDGALLDGIAFGVIDDPALVQSTLERLEVLKTGSGGYRRVTGPTDYEKHEFMLVDFALARVHVKHGRHELAEALVRPIVQRALADNGFIPEMVVSFTGGSYPGDIGAPAGAVPMVGYGPGAYVLYLVERGP